MNRTSPRSPAALLAVLTALALVAGACSGDDGGSGDGADADALVLTAVSTRADMVTGGDVLVSVEGGEPETTEVDGEPSDVDFERLEQPGNPVAADTWVGLVSGLPEGEATITVSAGGETAELDVVNHPRSGPVFSGERLPMTLCTTERFALEASSPPECAAEAATDLAYVDAEGLLRFVDSTEDVPEDAASVDIDGEEQPAILRVERGVIDRGVYTITTLADADGGEEQLEEFDAEGWNGRLVYRFGGGCGTTYAQGFNLFSAPDLDLLAEGYAFATNTLNTFQVQCQDILSAEAAMMTKEHFVENYGVPVVTLGEGGSGGAIQQLLIAQNYPGILDAIAPSLPFPDAVSIAPGVVDCALLQNFHRSPAGAGWTEEQRAAVYGHQSTRTCVFWEQTFVPVIDPTTCGFGDAVSGTGTDRAIPGLADGLPEVPEDQRYDPETNPDGIRCTLQDSYPQIFEADPDTGFRERPVDNVGVQYGLAALNDGTIDLEQFLTLNEAVGGFDIDGNPVPERMGATAEQVEALYETGRVVQGGPLLDIPVLALNVYTDDRGDIHDRLRMFSLDARLADEDGEQAPNYVMWTRPASPGDDLLEQLSGAVSVGARATRLLDEWATEVAEDATGRTQAEKVEAARPEDGVNTCFDVEGAVVEYGPDVYEGPGPCTDPYPVHDDPRTAAGAPLANDVLKCELQSVPEAVDAGVYEVELSPEAVGRLEAVFPDGVCDWSQPGVGRAALGEPWQTYG